MATNLDLQEQEQLDELKAFWKQYGNLITWVLTLALAGFAALNGWNWWQREQAVKASAMFEEMDRAVQAGEMDKAAQAFNDLKDRFGRTAFAPQAGLALARLQADKGQADAARGTLAWVAAHASDDDLKALAALRLSALLLDAGQLDEAFKQLDAVTSPVFVALVKDRRGDVLMAQGKKSEATQAWLAAWKGLDDKQEYRQVVEAKLNAAGVTVDKKGSTQE